LLIGLDENARASFRPEIFHVFGQMQKPGTIAQIAKVLKKMEVQRMGRRELLKQ
jgi:hypothetical protein